MLVAKTKRDTDFSLFDCSDVEVEILPSKRRDQVDIRLTSDSDLNLLRIYGALQNIIMKLERELEIMEEAEGEH